MQLNKIYQGNSLEVLKTLPSESVNCCITSPPYWGLRDYGVGGQLGLEKTPEEYVQNLVSVFKEVKRVLKKDGTCWLNLGDSYLSDGTKEMSAKEGSGIQADQRAKNENYRGTTPTRNARYYKNTNLKRKDLVGIPWRVAFALQADGWYLRQDIIWAKPNPMPESVTDRCTKSHEYIFLLAKSQKYYFDNEAIREPVKDVSLKRAEYGWDSDRPSTKNASMGGEGIHTEKMGTRFVNPTGRNKRSVWTVTTKPYSEAHFATFPEDLIVPMIKAGCPPKGIVLDPFIGAGTTGLVAQKLNRNWIGIELNENYIKLANERLKQKPLI